MSTASVQSPTLYLQEPTRISASREHIKAKLWDIASKVMLVAALAIIAVVLTIGFVGTSIVTHGAALWIFGLTLATPVLIYLSKIFADKAQHHLMKGTIETGVAEQEKKSFETDAFFRKHRLGKTPSMDVRPLIARYHYWKNLTDEQLAEARRCLDWQNPDPALRFESRTTGWRVLEELALPAKIQSAVVLQMIAHPDQAINLSKIGHARILSIGERLSERLYDKNDSYFEFVETRAPLTVNDLETMSPSELREALFTTSI